MLRLGWAVRDMTPSRPVMLHGQMHRRISTGVMDPILATAVAVEGGDPTDCAILISTDLCAITEELQQAVRAGLVARFPDLPPQKVFLVATHTHTSLVYTEGIYPPTEGDVMTPREGTDWIVQHAVEAGVAAWERRSPHTVASAFGHAVVGHNRRAAYADGTSQMYGGTNRPDFECVEGYEDHSFDAVFAWDEKGKLRGLLLDIPCPSQVDEGLEVISADYWHEVRLELKKRLGQDLTVVPLCGAGGDISPHFLLYARQEAEMRKRRGVTERQEIAIRVADGVERALDCTPQAKGEAVFAHTVRQLDLSARRISKEERDRAEAEHARALTDQAADAWWPVHLRKTVEDFDSGRVAPPVPVEVHVLRLGDVTLATNPFELYLDYGLRVKAQSPAAQTVIVQLAGGRASYLPTARAIQGGGYGAVPASTGVGPEGGTELVEGTLAMIRELFPG